VRGTDGDETHVAVDAPDGSPVVKRQPLFRDRVKRLDGAE
jgi:hypothetical protein